MLTTGEILGLAEWIIDDICLVFPCPYGNRGEMSNMAMSSGVRKKQVKQDICVINDPLSQTPSHQ